MKQQPSLFPIELSTSNEVLDDTLNVFKEAVQRNIESATFVTDTVSKQLFFIIMITNICHLVLESEF